jgi:hypothetical protein
MGSGKAILLNPSAQVFAKTWGILLQFFLLQKKLQQLFCNRFVAIF